MAQIWFVLHETLHTTVFVLYYCVERIRIVNHSHILSIETSDNEHRSYDSEEDQILRYERMAEDALPIDNDFETEDAPPMDAPTTSKKRKGGGPSKNLNVTKCSDHGLAKVDFVKVFFV